MSSDSQSPSDEDLARQTQAGSMPAFEELVSRYEQRIYAFVAQSCRNGMDATEITQETFVKAFQAIEQFDLRRSFAAWLFTIARRKCVDHFRAMRPTGENNSTPELSDINDPAEILASQDERQYLWKVARRILSASQFQALWLRYVEDMSLSEMAGVLGRPQAYIKVLIFRARKTLGDRLKPTRVASHSSRQSIPHIYEILVR
jgi:RNA polymerase sigma-70 factor (ECF subfamily)